MASFLEEVGRAVRQTACAVIALNDDINGFLEGIGTPGAQEYADRTRALRRQLCDNDDDNVPIPTAPFAGGQCSTNYRVFISVTRTSDGSQFLGPEHPAQNPTQNNNNRWSGPIDGISIVRDPSNSSRWGWAIDHAPGTTFGTFSISSSDLSASIDRVERVDGLADDCGSIDSPVPPYVPTPTTVNISYQNNQEITVNEDVDITVFSPQVNLIGGIFAPITISGNTFNLVGTVELTPEFKLNLSPEINIGTGGGNTDNPAPNPDRPYPEPTLPAGERRVIVGAVVTATSVSDRQDFIPQADNPDIGVPNLGYIAFYIATDNARAWTSDIPIKNVRSYIPCPVAAGAVDVTGTGRSGTTIQVQPVWGYPSQHVQS